MRQVLYIVSLLAYLNILCYEVKYCSFFYSTPLESNETLLEFVFEEVLNLSHSDSQETIPTIIFDDYRILSLALAILPVVLFFSWLVRRIFPPLKDNEHPTYLSKTMCLPGYYNFLYRLRPF